MRFTKKQSSDPASKRALWGEEIVTVAAIADVFSRFVQKRIKKFPFSEGPMTGEADLIRDELLSLNRNKFLTINSQPRVNGAPSSDPIFGWGPAKGYIYQKPYFEFFIPE
jgi:methylenetetrahydrofolate reductase (NADPH)